MTTQSAEAQYLNEHLAVWAGKGYAAFNPQGKKLSELPVIYGFNNGGSEYFLSAVLLAEDGTGLGGHGCSNECYMRSDLGILEGSRPDRHDGFKKHYPDGYRMDFVSYEDVPGHEELNKAIELSSKKDSQGTKGG